MEASGNSPFTPIETAVSQSPSRWRIILAITIHEVIHIAKTPAVMATISIPAFMLLLFRVVFSNIGETGVLPVAVYDPGNSRVMAVLQDMTSLEIQSVHSEADLSAAMDEVSIGIVVPADFETAVANNQQPGLTIYLNPDSDEQFEVTDFQHAFTEKLWLDLSKPPVYLDWQNIATDELNSGVVVAKFLLIFMILMSMGMVGNMLSVLMVEEKDGRTLDSLLLSPASNLDVLLGKGIAGTLYSCITAVLLIPIGGAIPQVWSLMGVGIFLGSLLMVSLGLLMGIIFETKLQCNSWGGLIMLILFIPGWFLTLPVNVPVLEVAIRLLPTYYLIRGMTPALDGEFGLAQVMGDFGLVILSVLLVGGVIQWRVKRPLAA